MLVPDGTPATVMLLTEVPGFYSASVDVWANKAKQGISTSLPQAKVQWKSMWIAARGPFRQIFLQLVHPHLFPSER